MEFRNLSSPSLFFFCSSHGIDLRSFFLYSLRFCSSSTGALFSIQPRTIWIALFFPPLYAPRQYYVNYYQFPFRRSFICALLTTWLAFRVERMCKHFKYVLGVFARYNEVDELGRSAKMYVSISEHSLFRAVGLKLPFAPRWWTTVTRVHCRGSSWDFSLGTMQTIQMVW